MDRQSNEPKRLKAEDFRRLGIRLQEWRPAIIREAAARIAKELARKQLESPNEQTARELSSVTVSAYRVLDPRRRHDSIERISVGRILPLALHAASQTKFCHGIVEPKAAQQPTTTLSTDASELMSDESLAEMIEQLVPATPVFGLPVTESVQLLDRSSSTLAPQPVPASTPLIPLETAFDPGNHFATRLESESLLKYYPLKRFVGSARRMIQRPAFVASLVVLTVATTIWISRFGQDGTSVVASNLVPSSVSPKTNMETEIELSAASVERAQVTAPSVSPVSGDADSVEQDQAVSVSGDKRASLAMSSEAEPSHADEPFDLRNADSLELADGTVLTDGTVNSAELWLPLVGQKLKQWMDFVDNTFASSKVNSKAAPSVAIESSSNASRPEILAVDQVSIPVPDEQSRVEADQRLRHLLPPSANLISPETSALVLSRLAEIRSQTKPGTADRWVVTMFAAKVGWSIENAAQVFDRLQALADVHQIAVEPLLAESLLQRQPFVETESAHRRVMRGGLLVTESLLRNQLLEQSQQLVDSTKRSAEFLADDEAMLRLQEYKEALEQMSRLRLKANEIVQWADPNDVSASDAAIAGRYECLYRRNWQGGLIWLASSKDPRMAVLAQAELDLQRRVSGLDGQSGSDAARLVENEFTQLATRWLAVASRSTGRVAESMRLHALTLHEKALTTARGTQKLTIQLAIDEIRASLPNVVFDSAYSSDPAFRTL